MRKALLIALALFFIFSTNAFAFLTFKQSKDISGDTVHLRGITFKPDGTRMYVTADEDDPVVLQYSLSTPFDISTTISSSIYNFSCVLSDCTCVPSSCKVKLFYTHLT